MTPEHIQEIKRLVTRMKHEHIGFACKMRIRQEAEVQRIKDGNRILEILELYQQ